MRMVWRVMVESPGIGERGIERILAAVTEGWMAEIVGQAQCFRQILVEAERARDCAADLGDFEAVRQAHPEMIAVRRDEHLRLVAQPAKRDRVDDPVAVALENIARTGDAGIGFRMVPAA